MKYLRRIHLYLGCFITPLLVMYLVSGFYFILNPERQKDEGEAQSLMQKLWWMHTDQQWPRGVSEEIDPLAEDQPKTITTWEADTKLFKGLVYLMVVIAVASIIIGLILAFRSAKDKKPAIGVILAGILIPFLFLITGQKQVQVPNPFHPGNVDLAPGQGYLLPEVTLALAVLGFRRCLPAPTIPLHSCRRAIRKINSAQSVNSCPTVCTPLARACQSSAVVSQPLLKRTTRSVSSASMPMAVRT